MKKGEVTAGIYSAYLDFAILCGSNVAIMSVFERSQQVLRAFSATINLGHCKISYGAGNETIAENYDSRFRTYFAPVIVGKEKFFHALLISEYLDEKIIITNQKRKGKDFYHFLMRKFDLPLLEWWGEPLLQRLLDKNIVVKEVDDKKLKVGDYSCQDKLLVDQIQISDLDVYDLSKLELIHLKECITELFQEHQIYITKKTQNNITIKTLGEYFEQYGHTLVDNLKKILKPETRLTGEVTSFTLRKIRLYPQQAAMVNGTLHHLKNNNYIILNEGMGVGKTCQAACICEGFFVEKYLRVHPKIDLKDIYMQRDLIKYRNIVMCPGHMVEKWAAEIGREVPFSKVHILRDFSQLVALRKRGPERTCREFWVMSKDFAKLSYMQSPTPSKMVHDRPIYDKLCESCGHKFMSSDVRCPKCNGKKITKGDAFDHDSGMICPDCGELLVVVAPSKSGYTEHDVLKPESFSSQTQKNLRCFYCGSSLWQPFVKNIDQINWFHPKIRKPVWNRATHYANKTRKGIKSVWVHKRYANRYFEEVGASPLNVKSDMEGCRKYSPATFIKRYMKGFFDFSVFDECHLYKGGSTGQGNAMDALIKSSNKQIALTGTIAGGMAEHIFYLMYRLDPRKMIEKGFGWTDNMRFTETYGTTERIYEIDTQKSGNNNVMSRGRQISSPKSKPGISPCVFTDFLIDCAVFLDLSDLSKHLPKLHEYVITVPICDCENDDISIMFDNYNRVIDCLQKAKKEEGKGILGRMIQFSLSYLDKPFGDEAIISPVTGEIVVNISQYPNLWTEGLLPKERKLIDIVRRELEENRNCFVFAEYTASEATCVTRRLKDILEKELGIRVSILESSSPEPTKREAWIHERAEKDQIQVFIANPRCVETGLDFCWEKDGVIYNYPTLIFYQIGYSLFTVWQASRRAYRITQKEECRNYYLAYEGTIQEVVVRLIAEKQAATSAIQGKFSVEGLCAMARGVDTKMIIAQALAEKDFSTENDLQAMFDVLSNQETEDEMDSCERMSILCEIIGTKHLMELDAVEREPDMDDLLLELLDGSAWNLLDTEPVKNEEVIKVGLGKEVTSLFSLFLQ